jgi:hypothetical protein
MIESDEESSDSQSIRLQPPQISRILVVDDEPYNLKAMEIILLHASRQLNLDT